MWDLFCIIFGIFVGKVIYYVYRTHKCHQDKKKLKADITKLNSLRNSIGVLERYKNKIPRGRDI